MIIFITELTAGYYSVRFISENGSEKYYRYNEELLFDEKQKSILQDIERSRTLGGSLMGIVGMLVFIPIVSVLYTLLRENVHARLEEKDLHIE